MRISEGEEDSVDTVLVRYKIYGEGGEGFVSVTEWANGEGWDVQVTDTHGAIFYAQMTDESWAALRRAMGIIRGKLNNDGTRRSDR